MDSENTTWTTCLGCDAVYVGEVCTKCQDEAARHFDDAMWGWLTPEIVAIAEREQRTGEIPAA